MMLHPTVQELTNDKVNRYKLVIATAKCARHILQKTNDEREIEEKHRLELDRFGRETKSDMNDVLMGEKPVSLAVKKLFDGNYRIISD